MIEDYFQRIEALITGAGIVRFFNITYDKRSTSIGFIRGSIYFLDGSLLHLREFIDVEYGTDRYVASQVLSRESTEVRDFAGTGKSPSP